jgi:hypothetical protein
MDLTGNTVVLLLFPVAELVSVGASIIVVSNCCCVMYLLPNSGCSIVAYFMVILSQGLLVSFVP